MDALTTVVTQRKEKRYCVTFNHSLCHYSWHLCFCFFALISPPSNKEKRKETCCLYSQKSELLFPICDARPQRWSLTKLGLKVKCEFSPTSFHTLFLRCSLQALLYLSSNLVPHPLASHPEFLAQCRKFSQLPEVWCIPGLFLIWAPISSKNEALYQCFSNISGEFL